MLSMVFCDPRLPMTRGNCSQSFILVHKKLLMYYLHKDLLMISEDVVFKAIAHPARRGIIRLLAVSARSVKELTAEFDISQSAISQHLKELKEAQLVTSERSGLEQRYRLTPQPLRYVLKWSEGYRPLIDTSGHIWALAPKGHANRQQTAERKSRHGR
jgi:DNA-binding transcriptional ArsR family regulator